MEKVISTGEGWTLVVFQPHVNKGVEIVVYGLFDSFDDAEEYVQGLPNDGYPAEVRLNNGNYSAIKALPYHIVKIHLQG